MGDDGSMTDIDSWAAVHEATIRLVRTVDGLPDSAYSEPSVLPGWSRAHVISHLALNAEGLAEVMRGLVAGDETPMYPSQERRDGDIDDLASADVASVRDRFLSGCTLFQEAWEHMTDDAWTGTFPRVPGADPWPASRIPPMRHGEVEIHHADLAAGYGVADWPEAYLDATFNRVVRDRQDGSSMMLRTPEGDVPIGTGQGPVVSGSRADLTWWLLGRGGGRGLTGDPSVPTLGPWR
jgi:maleylpyruvate isomerase